MGCVTFSLFVLYDVQDEAAKEKEKIREALMHETRYMCISQPKSVCFVAHSSTSTAAAAASERACLNQMDNVINDYLYINEIMSFRAIQHLFIYTHYILFRSFGVFFSLGAAVPLTKYDKYKKKLSMLTN